MTTKRNAILRCTKCKKFVRKESFASVCCGEFIESVGTYDLCPNFIIFSTTIDDFRINNVKNIIHNTNL